MGYLTRIELIDVKIKRGHMAALRRYIKANRDDEEGEFHYFLKYLKIEDRLVWWDVPGASGKWYADEEFAAWLGVYAEAGGRVILHSEELDGNVWGWEFDGLGKKRRLVLQPEGPWE